MFFESKFRLHQSQFVNKRYKEAKEGFLELVSKIGERADSIGVEFRTEGLGLSYYLGRIAEEYDKDVEQAKMYYKSSRFHDAKVRLALLTEDMEEKISLLEHASACGNREAHYLLGKYENRLWRKISNFREAAKLGHLEALKELYCSKQRKDLDKLLQDMVRSVEISEKDKFLALGLCHQFGYAVKHQDFQEAIKMFEQAIHYNDESFAQHQIDIIKSFDAKFKSAMTLKSDNWNDATVQRYYRPKFTEPNVTFTPNAADHKLKEAKSMLKSLSDEGMKEAVFQLAEFYNDGKGAEMNYAIATDLYEIPAYLGDAEAQFRYANLLFNEFDRKNELGLLTKAVENYQKSAIQNHTSAMVNLGILYERGLVNGTVDCIKAEALYQQAMNIDDHTAAVNALATLYANGEGIHRDIVQMVHFFWQAIREGDSDAIDNWNFLTHSDYGRNLLFTVLDKFSEEARFGSKAAKRDYDKLNRMLGMFLTSSTNPSPKTPKTPSSTPGTPPKLEQLQSRGLNFKSPLMTEMYVNPVFVTEGES